MFKYLTILPCFFTLFLWIWLIRPLPVARIWRVLAGLALLLGACNLLLIPLNSGYQTELPKAAVIALNWLYILTLTTGVTGLLYLLGTLLLWFWLPVLRRPLVRLAVVGGLGVVLATFGQWQGLKVPEVRDYTVTFPNLPADLRGLRIALLTDLHVGPLYDAAWTTELVRRVNAAKPDLIAVVGDIVDGPVSLMLPHVAPLGDLRAPLGVFYAPGNHEYYSGYREWMQAVDSLGLHILENAHVQLSAGTATLTVAGVADPAGLRYRGSNLPVPDIQAALTGAPSKAPPPATFTLLLAHQPRNTAENAAAGVDLQLSGHTHGGTILPLQPLIRDFNDGFVSGLYTVDAMRLFVSNGAGLWSGVSLRLGVPSEIPLLQLQ